MPTTLRLECVNSFNHPKFVSADRSVRLYDKDNHRVPRGRYTYVNNYNYRNAIQEFGGGSSNDTRYVGLVFENPDLSFLDTSQVFSAKLVVTIALSVSNDNFSFSFGMLDYRPDSSEFQEGYWDGIIDLEDVWYGSEAIENAFNDKSGIFKIINGGIESGTVVEVDLTNSIDVVKKVSAYGMGIYCRKVTACGAYGVSASPAQRPYIEIVYDSDFTPPDVKPASPVSEVVNGDAANTFSWTFSQAMNEPQSHYTLQYKSENTWTALVNKVKSAAHSYKVPAKTLPAGQVSWRVKAWTKNGTIESPWSDEAYIIVESSPDKPNITNSTSSPRPAFTWQAAQQQGYQVRLNDYDSGTIYGVSKSWQSPNYLPDGQAAFSVRVQNAQGIWSDWSSINIYIQNKPGVEIALSVKPYHNGASLTWSGDYADYQILRDGIVIAETKERSFVDYLSVGKHAYTVRGLLAGGYYTPSNTVTEIIKIQDAVISLLDPIDWLTLSLKLGQKPSHERSVQYQVNTVHYEGRRLPVAYTNGFADISNSISYTLKSREDYEKLLSMAGKEVILKNRFNECVIGFLSDISCSAGKVFDFTFNIIETDRGG